MTKVGNIATVAVSVICLILWISVISYYKSWDKKSTNWDLMYVVSPLQVDISWLTFAQVLELHTFRSQV
jgi:uncharacterized membrane protein